MKIITAILLIFLLVPPGLYGQDYEPLCSKERLGGSFLGKSKVSTENQMGFDIKSYDLYLKIFPDSRNLIGENRIKGIVSGTDTLDILEFDLMYPMGVDSVISDLKSLSFSHYGNILTITPLQPILPDSSFDLTIYYRGTPYTPTSGWASFNFNEYNGNPMVWTLSEPYGARTWWPCKDTPVDKADSMKIKISLPFSDGDTLVAVSNGILVDTNYDNGFVTYSWETGYPMATYLASISVYPYVHWREWFHFGESDSMPLDYYAFENWEQTAKNSFAVTSDMMVVFNDLFGEYPFKNEKYGHYMFLFGGGMEHQTMTGLGTMNESVIAHELAHQWYGDLVTCEDFGHIWLNEGFARYSQALWEEFYYGKNARDNFMKGIEYYGAGTVFVPKNSSVSRIFNGNLTYNKAGWVVHMLRYVMGDSTFFEVLKDFTTDPMFKFKTMNTEQLRDYYEGVSGMQLDNFFQQWIYGEYYPDYSYDWSQSGDTLKYWINQGAVVFDMPVDLGIISGNDTLIQRVDVSGKSNSGYVLVEEGFSATEVILDPENWVLNKAFRVYGLGVDNTLPETFSVGFPFPNPFNPNVKLSFIANSKTTAIVTVFDLAGNRVKTNELKTAIGENTFSWDGRSDTGQELATGVYMIRISIDGYSQVRKAIYLK